MWISWTGFIRASWSSDPKACGMSRTHGWTSLYPGLKSQISTQEYSRGFLATRPVDLYSSTPWIRISKCHFYSPYIYINLREMALLRYFKLCSHAIILHVNLIGLTLSLLSPFLQDNIWWPVHSSLYALFCYPIQLSSNNLSLSLNFKFIYYLKIK